MTLLEALVAVVILGTSVVGFLGVFQSGARAVQSADVWNRASSAAASVIEEAVRSRLEGSSEAIETSQLDAGIETRVAVQPWRGRVDDVVVRVTLPDGRAMTVHRLIRRR